MPKRTNAFQTLIARIERLVASPQASVRESVELSEYADSSPREIDVLIEDQVSGYPVRIAIECRDYKKKQDKSWIDELIGKYRDLGIDKIIAVSSSGFTKGALQKAAKANIQALTLREALEQDWDAALLKPRIKFAGNVTKLVGARLEFSPEVPPIPPGTDFNAWLIEGASGEDPETVFATALRLYRSDGERGIEDFIKAQNLPNFSDPTDREFDVEIGYGVTNRVLVSPDGVRRPITKLTLRAHAEVRFIDAAHRDVVYERKLTTLATLDEPGFGQHSVTIVQIVGDPTRTVRFAYERPATAAKSAGKRRRGKNKK